MGSSQSQQENNMVDFGRGLRENRGEFSNISEALRQVKERLYSAKQEVNRFVTADEPELNRFKRKLDEAINQAEKCLTESKALNRNLEDLHDMLNPGADIQKARALGMTIYDQISQLGTSLSILRQLLDDLHNQGTPPPNGVRPNAWYHRIPRVVVLVGAAVTIAAGISVVWHHSWLGIQLINIGCAIATTEIYHERPQWNTVASEVQAAKVRLPNIPNFQASARETTGRALATLEQM